MKQKVSDYIADYIAEWGIRDVFTVTGESRKHQIIYNIMKEISFPGSRGI